jgi:hypothetical protein
MTLGWRPRALIATMLVIGLLGAESVALTGDPPVRSAAASSRPVASANASATVPTGFEIAPSLLGPPTVLYADPNMFSFTADYSSDRAGYDALVSNTAPLLRSNGIPPTLDQQSDVPMKTCIEPTRDGSTVVPVASVTAATTFFFGLDSTNVRVPDAYALWRQVNDGAPEVLVRNVLPDTVPFLAYRYLVGPSASSDSLADVPIALLPITSADTSFGEIGIQSLRIVEMHFLITNGLSHGAQRLRRVNLVVTLPQAVHIERPSCTTVPSFAANIALSSALGGSRAANG